MVIKRFIIVKLFVYILEVFPYLWPNTENGVLRGKYKILALEGALSFGENHF